MSSKRARAGVTRSGLFDPAGSAAAQQARFARVAAGMRALIEFRLQPASAR
jgi:hypothetical protein